MTGEVSLFVDEETIRLTREGVWLSNDHEITHGEQVRAFFRSLARDEEGWLIRIGNNEKHIEVEDTAYFVTHVSGTSDAGFEITVSDGVTEPLDPQSIEYETGRLICLIERGGERVEARFLRTAYNELLGFAEEDSRGYFLRAGDAQIKLT